MKKVYIKYNPYRLLTEITVDGKMLADNSRLLELISREDPPRLQEWVEDLPQILVDEYNDTEFEVTFHGTLLDYEDLTDVFTNAYNQGTLTATLNRIPAKETADKEALIDEVFKEITNDACPFKELRDPEIVAAFNMAKSSDFEVCVVATMSAGKSTLINSMLRTKLMPSKQEACTAIITRIKDTDADHFRAEVYHKDGDPTGTPAETHEHVTYQIMDRLNADPDVSTIQMFGNIPFLTADDVSLVLIDTPGPNNSRDPSHRAMQKELLGKNSKALVLYIMTGEFGTDDDNKLLKQIADSMSVGGKKSRDRFIFVVNKMDDRKKEDGDVNQTLERVRSYLKSHGISNPNLFPAAALPAMNIRLLKSGELIDDDDKDEVETKIRKLNRNDTLHFESYAILPPSIRGEIRSSIDEVRTNWQGEPLENPDEALIHSGIISIEAAIRQYVQKYAKTAKIKNIVDAFTHKLDEQRYNEDLKKELASNQAERERFLKEIAEIEKKIDSAKEAQKFEDTVRSTVKAVNADSKEIVESIITKFQERVSKRILDLKDDELELSEVDYEVERLTKFAKKLEPDFQAELSDLIRSKLIGTCDTLIENYKKKLTILPEAGGIKIEIDPLKLVGGSIVSDSFSTRRLVEEKKVPDGEEWVPNTSKKWYKPWTWFQESGYYRTKYKSVKFVKGDKLAQEFFSPLQEVLYDQGDAARIYAEKQCENIARSFEKEFKALDGVLKAKLSELKNYATDVDKAEDRIKEAEEKIEWLDAITAKVESILEI